MAEEFIRVLLGIFAIFLWWSAFTRFQATLTYDIGVIIGFVGGAILLFIAYKFR